MADPPSRRRGAPGSLAVVRGLRRVGRDRTSGAHGLAESTLGLLERWAGDAQLVSSGVLVHDVDRIATELAGVQPAMGLFRRWAREWREFPTDLWPPALQTRIARWVRGWRARLRKEGPLLARTVAQNLPPRERVLTLSRSTSVLFALTRLPRARRPRVVTVLESRPGGEGRALARDLDRAGFEVRLVADEEGTRRLSEVDRVILGADTIYASGAVAHKVGTRPLALAASRRAVPVVIIAGISKAVPERRPRRRLPPLFDLTPPGAIDAYWTDAGAVLGGRWNASIGALGPTRLSRSRS